VKIGRGSNWSVPATSLRSLYESVFNLVERALQVQRAAFVSYLVGDERGKSGWLEITSRIS
jgi:hypothetical protein